MPLKPSSSRRTSFIHFSEPWLGTSSTSGYPAITPSAPDFVIAACQGGRKFSRSERSESSMAPRSRPLVGSLCVGKSVIILAQRLCPGRRCLRPALPVRYFPRFGNRDKGLPCRLLRFAPSLGRGRARARALRARGYLRSALPGRQRRKLISPAAYQTCYQWPNLLEKLSRPET